MPRKPANASVIRLRRFLVKHRPRPDPLGIFSSPHLLLLLLQPPDLIEPGVQLVGVQDLLRYDLLVLRQVDALDLRAVELPLQSLLRLSFAGRKQKY